MRQVFPHARGLRLRTLAWPTVFDVGTSPRPRRLLGTHHTYEQRLAALSQLSYSPPGFPRTPVASPTDTTSCLAAAPWVRGVSATTWVYRPPTGLGHPAPERTCECAHSPALRETKGSIAACFSPFANAVSREKASRIGHATATRRHQADVNQPDAHRATFLHRPHFKENRAGGTPPRAPLDRNYGLVSPVCVSHTKGQARWKTSHA
jgi:hypothetical protein